MGHRIKVCPTPSPPSRRSTRDRWAGARARDRAAKTSGARQAGTSCGARHRSTDSPQGTVAPWLTSIRLRLQTAGRSAARSSWSRSVNRGDAPDCSRIRQRQDQTMSWVIGACSADLGDGPGQDARGPALRQFELFPKNAVMLRELLRLLPARSASATTGHLHREDSSINDGIDKLRPRPRARCSRGAT